jgi:hypothetical protein
MKVRQLLSIVLLILLGKASVNAQFTFVTNNGAINITGYLGTDGTVVIPGMINGYPVTSIGSSAFFYQTTLTNVTIPGSITNIGFQAFTGCGLTSVSIPDGVVTIGQSAFMHCSSLTNVSFGNSVTSIADGAFYGCTSLTNVFIPKNVTNIYSTAFVYCSNLTALDVDVINPAFSSVDGVLFDKYQTILLCYPAGLPGNYFMPGSVISIGDNAFEFCFNFTNVIIPDAVTTIGRSAFYGCENISHFTLSSNLVSIGSSAFSACKQLFEIAIPTNVITIGKSAFSSTGLKNVWIPPSVTTIGTGAFGCSSLTAIDVASGNPAYSSVDGILFNIDQTTIVEFPIRKSGTPFKPTSYSIPSSVTNIGDAAFQSCWFSNITVPAGVISIGGTAFSGCSKMTSLVIPDGVTFIGHGAFESTGITNLIVPSSVTTFADFGTWSKLRNIYFLGNAPNPGTNTYVQFIINGATVFYLPGTTGWGTSRFGVPTALWLPALQFNGIDLTGRSNGFGFNINWASGQTVVVEACTNISQSAWIPLATNTLSNGINNFADAQWHDYPARFYRVHMQ